MRLSSYKREEALPYCQKIIEQFDTIGSLVENPKEMDPQGFFSVKQLFSPHKGQMFGVLVCRPTPQTDLSLCDLTEDGCIIVKAFSGQFFGTWSVPGWVEPCFPIKDWNEEVMKSDSAIKEVTEKIERNQDNKNTLKELQKKLSNDCLKRIYDLYTFHCKGGKVKKFSDFYALHPPFYNKAISFILPPTGTGDCCAPKLLNYAFMHGLKPISLAEFYYGSPTKSGSKKHLEYYEPCIEKCSIVLPELLGIEIIYCDEDIVVVNKPAGMLSVPGRTLEKKDCAVKRVRKLFPDCIPQPATHRLDMETSGLLVMGLTKEAHRHISLQFQEKKTQKEYIALLDGSLFLSEGEAAKKAVTEYKKTKTVLEGTIELPFRLDIDNRPHQIYDELYGKMGITYWKKIREEKKDGKTVTRILFKPLTGRTHQLRLHSYHKKGLGCPIIGDSLYATRSTTENRMMLHAAFLSFEHPRTRKQMEFRNPPPF